MKYIGELMSYILFAVFAQNLLLGRAIGMSDIMTACRGKRRLLTVTLAVGAFSALGVMPVWLLSRFVHSMNTYLIFALLHSLICAVCCFAADRLLLRLNQELYDRWGRLLPGVLINSIVVGAPVSALASGIPTWYAALGYAFGCGLGLGLAVIIIRNGLEILDNPDLPGSFRGVPVMLIYLGILSLGFCAFL